ncbi:MAG: phosphoribosylaminoimidazolesuccinocarboxamide synthase [Saprospiraceae bacterium]|nr:phosphoribosylaminoimidazolesuccinocarboxamide synthase [Saprospiraceae bacterium]
MQGLKSTQFSFPGQTNFYKGKVRDVYYLEDQLIVIASDRISAFDHVLPKAIPFKGQILNQIALHFLLASEDIVPNWLKRSPDPNVSIGIKAEPIKIEMVVRGYLAGHAWREYKAGKRTICGVAMPDGMKEGDKFPNPLITPATKADEGHDEDISKEEILARDIITERDWNTLSRYAHDLFYLGSQMANDNGLILVDTKYEFGKHKGQIILIDEIHTPDSSRYYIKEGYKARQESGEKQKQLSKEFVREWLMDNGFQGIEGQTMPDMPDSFVSEISERYIELYEKITGTEFQKADYENIEDRIYQNVMDYLNRAE